MGSNNMLGGSEYNGYGDRYSIGRGSKTNGSGFNISSDKVVKYHG